ncbi:MAG: winged helix-turn-helix domain-containing protein [Candidatus Aenigmatarchaeota archaeon]
MVETLDKETLKALSTDTRQEIIKLLSKRPYTASEISKHMAKHVTTIAEHLEVLEKSGLIKRKESENKWVYYELTGKGEKIFKPTYYTWIITISVVGVAIFGVIMYGMGTYVSTYETSAMQKELAGYNMEVFSPVSTDQSTIIPVGIQTPLGMKKAADIEVPLNVNNPEDAYVTITNTAEEGEMEIKLLDRTERLESGKTTKIPLEDAVKGMHLRMLSKDIRGSVEILSIKRNISSVPLAETHEIKKETSMKISDEHGKYETAVITEKSD